MNSFVLFIIDNIFLFFFYQFGCILSNYWAGKHQTSLAKLSLLHNTWPKDFPAKVLIEPSNMNARLILHISLLRAQTSIHWGKCAANIRGWLDRRLAAQLLHVKKHVNLHAV